MQAVVIKEWGGPEVLELVDKPEPEPGKGEVRVRVKATGVNRADLLQRQGHYPAPSDWPADIPGLEFAGIVDQIGEQSYGFSLGEPVFGLVGGGAYCQYIVVNAGELMKIPAHLNFTDAAAVPEAFITAYDAMVSQCLLMSGEIVLINAVASGVGTAAMQIAKLLGATTIGTSRSHAKLIKAKELGLDHGICVEDGKFCQEVMGLTNQRGADLIVELVGGAYVNEGIKCMAHRGRSILIGLTDGRRTEIDLALILGKRLELRGTTLRNRLLHEKIEAASSFSKHVLPFFAKGQLKPVIDRIWPLAEASKAHAYLEANQSFGKVILQID